MRIAVIQLPPATRGTQATLNHVAGRLEAARGAALVCLPELWHVGYPNFDRYTGGAQPADGPLTQWLARRARDLGAVLHGGSFLERDGGRLYNTAVLFDRDGRRLGSYRKIHLFGAAGRERELLTAGDQLVTADAGWGRVGLATCYDLRFPELFRRLVDLGATVLLVPAAWRRSALADWRLLCRARALENQCFLIAAAVCGAAGGMRFSGHSMVVDPTGRIVAEAGEQETILFAEIDPGQIAETRRRFPVLKDRMLRP
jgi:predicted amidohydrolase